MRTNEDKYTPPADERINEKQLEMYVAVRRRELQISRDASSRLKAKSTELKARGEKPGIVDGLDALEQVGSVLAADVRAAVQAGYNSAEYQWVKARVIEAGASGANEEFQRATRRIADQSQRYYRTQLAQAGSPEERNMWQQSIAALAKQTAGMEKSTEASEALRHNRELVRRHQSELDGIRSETATDPREKR